MGRRYPRFLSRKTLTRSKYPRSLSRLADRPFATALSGVLLTGGIIAVTHTGLTADALEGLVPTWMAVALALSYAVSGGLLLAGMAFERDDVEAAGCVLATSGLIIRLISLFTVIGLIIPVLATAAFYVLLMWAFVERLRQILSHQSIVRVSGKLRIDLGEVDDAQHHMG